ncbi:MAG: sigma 54-interacting transcriptional regulator, partial [Janthinobacterium lividum]
MHTLFLPAAPRTQLSAAASSAKHALTLLGPSTAMSQLWAQIRRLAPHVRTVLLTGASGSGQEAVARLLLDLSPAPRRSFVVLPEAEAEERLGRPSAIHALPVETFLFLPELERLSPAAQQGLLRLLRTRRSSGFSVIGAASEDLRALVSMGQFSPELAEALGSVRIAVPALKERLEDLPMLLNQMLSLRCHAAERPIPQLTEEFLRTAMQHAWPGNLDELTE